MAVSPKISTAPQIIIPDPFVSKHQLLIDRDSTTGLIGIKISRDNGVTWKILLNEPSSSVTQGSVPILDVNGETIWTDLIALIQANVTDGLNAASLQSGLSRWEIKDANFSVMAGHRYQVDTRSSAVTITLPIAAALSDEILIEDATSNWSLNNVTLDPNGLLINGSGSNYVGNTNGKKLSLVYISSDFGWSIK